MNGQATKAAVASYEPWEGDMFAGVRVSITGAPPIAGKRDYFPVEIASGWIADAVREPSGDVAVMLVCRTGIDPVAKEREIADQLIAAVTRKGFLGSNLSFGGVAATLAVAPALWALFALAFVAMPS
ncbi:hypothetical protein [Sphingomonas sp. 10B4]|uniref:hypothetical protein n=1 Tax=Sphingomonas sp. 10B4 TaxID=3048575 RepID=UPI002AB4AC2B|nr:hypothetical protein [Sphingomonas sp. 10B4]MDY7525861.1 hypothetical protein [Sphingomonas sp. 10B4]MEB0284399.1 hypothetical protein [Sphingomonas sp. 10B4]